MISGLKRISRPGSARVRRCATELPRVLGGLGIAVISTSHGSDDGQAGARRRKSAAKCSAKSGKRRRSRPCHELAENPSRSRRGEGPDRRSARSRSRARKANSRRRSIPTSRVEIKDNRIAVTRASDVKAAPGAARPLARARCRTWSTASPKGTPGNLNWSASGTARRLKGKKLQLLLGLLAPDPVRAPGRDQDRSADADEHHDQRDRQAAGRTGRGEDPLLPSARSRTRGRASSTKASTSAARPARLLPRAAPRHNDSEPGIRQHDHQEQNAEHRSALKRHIRLPITGTPERPRLTVFRSLKHVYAQIVDDADGQDPGRRVRPVERRRRAVQGRRRDRWRSAKHRRAARRAERRWRRISPRWSSTGTGICYHGVVKAMADGAREGGLKF